MMICAVFLLSATAFAQAEETPKLPDAYAEVVLSVDGMT